METEEMNCSSIDSTLGELSELQRDSPLELPENIWASMKKLRHVDIPRFRVGSTSSQHHEPGESSLLKDLQTFSRYCISSRDQPETVFIRMLRVKKLKLELGKNAQFPMVHFLSELESLNVRCKGRWKRPPRGSAINFPSTLKKLTLSRLVLPWSAISLISNLPNLEVLKLLQGSFDGGIWDMEDEGFIKLKFLKLYRLNLRQWNIASDDPFPCLEQLVVDRCIKLEEIPYRFGDIPTLKMIKVHRCREVEDSARHIEEEQLNLGNEGFDLIIDSYNEDLI